MTNGKMCPDCGKLITWFNHVFQPAPENHQRCHAQLCSSSRKCSRCRPIDSGWREKGWPR